MSDLFGVTGSNMNIRGEQHTSFKLNAQAHQGKFTAAGLPTEPAGVTETSSFYHWERAWTLETTHWYCRNNGENPTYTYRNQIDKISALNCLPELI